MPLPIEQSSLFSRRHIGPDPAEQHEMLETVGSSSLDEFINSVIPSTIRTQRPLKLDPPRTEPEAIQEMAVLAAHNNVFRSLIGTGYADTITPPVIQRNILENPGWYTQYTPYQAEISQGRLEALLNYQTMVSDLTGFEISNASLLDESTAAAEAMIMFFNQKGHPRDAHIFVSEACHPQTIAVVRTRAKALGIGVVTGNHATFEFSDRVFGALIQYPTTDGAVYDYRSFCDRAHASGAFVVVAADLLSLILLTPPAEFGADAAVGSTQRFGIPLGYGGPHAAYLAVTDTFKRLLPGRIIGVSVDARGNRALRMALQTREQHIRREKATSNICTSQVLLAIMAGMYAVYHGPEGLTAIARRIHGCARRLGVAISSAGFRLRNAEYFDTLRIECSSSERSAIEADLRTRSINLRWFADNSAGITLDERSDEVELRELALAFARAKGGKSVTLPDAAPDSFEGGLKRRSMFLQHSVFNSYRSETEMLRYIRMLESKDLSLTMSMIPLGSCTMKLNATTELLPVTWPSVNALHPFIPPEQAQGYRELLERLERMLCEITGFTAFSFQPNSGAQGEYTGLLVIRGYHESRGEAHRTVCLIPSSAHGTNPASAVMAGMDVVIVRSKDDGSIDIADLQAKAKEHAPRLGALMVTYPSTHGVFEEGIKDICRIVHEQGGLVYMDGANMNAQVGLCRPAELGADVCHLNLHKTFCIPHGGGGPGMGPIGVTGRLVPFLPKHPHTGDMSGDGAVASAPWGSPSILPISYLYIIMMGAQGLTEATKIAILNANYMAKRLDGPYRIVYTGLNNRVAHEFILDLRPFKESAGIEVEDVAKRLMDYGFHAPTTSFPVPGTLMIEPTESESKEELDRFCDAMIAIRGEIREIEDGRVGRENNVLRNAPHTAEAVTSDTWDFPYSREKAAYPLAWIRSRKFWPPVARINNVQGDRNLVCTCPPIESYEEERAEA